MKRKLPILTVTANLKSSRRRRGGIGSRRRSSGKNSEPCEGTIDNIDLKTAISKGARNEERIVGQEPADTIRRRISNGPLQETNQVDHSFLFFHFSVFVGSFLLLLSFRDIL
jgi:hypothetical protein